MKDFGVRANIFSLEDKEAFQHEVAESAILANGTSLGMKPLDDLSIVDDHLGVLREGLVVTDVVYNPRKTKLLQLAEEAGATVINGLGMMLWQGPLPLNYLRVKICPLKRSKNHV